ncbi:unnamed protein product, partial [Hapterophycus canaliculatus]
QVASVCLGIEHLINKRRRVAEETAVGDATKRGRIPAGQQARLCCENNKETRRNQHQNQHQHQRRQEQHRLQHQRKRQVRRGGSRDLSPSCRLCESTLRVLSIARAHERRCRQQQRLRRQVDKSDGDQKEDGTRATAAPAPTSAAGCDACRMWSMVSERCASLGIFLPNDGLMFPGG